ncbi:MAG: hypothetical protein ACKKL5_02755 [Candidatus Komeilibacteria bacterium]
MKEIVKIDAVALAKVCGLLMGGVYLLIGILINLAVLIFGLGSLSGIDFLGFGSGLVATLLVSIIVGAIVFVIGLIAGLLYNLIAYYFGGIIVLHEDRSVVEARLRESRAAKSALRAEKKRLQAERRRQEAKRKAKPETKEIGDDKEKDGLESQIPTP